MSQGYDSSIVVTYQFPALNFVSGAGTFKLPIPRSARFARVMDIMVVATTTFTQTTTDGVVQIGDGTTANAFAQLHLGGTTAGNSISGRDLTNAYGVWNANYLAGSNPAVGTAGVLHDLVMTIVAPTGGSPAGVGNVYVIVGYDQINRSPQT
jgi:hypothetical protein